MSNLHRYDNFEDLKNSKLSDKASSFDAAKAKADQDKWLALLKTASTTMVPAKRARKQPHNGK